jgi:cytochrome c-type biogenesis protein CcsB
MEPFDNIAVQDKGRLKSFASHSRSLMKIVNGGKSIAGQSPDFTYLDMMLRPDAYRDADAIYVKQKLMRTEIREQLAKHANVDPGILDTFIESGLISLNLLEHPAVQARLDVLERDLITTNKHVGQIRAAMAVARPGTLFNNLAVIPPPEGDEKSRWRLVDELMSSAPADAAHAGIATGGIPGIDSQTASAMLADWRALRDAWRDQDAVTVNKQFARIAADLRATNPQLYPEIERLKLESWYVEWKSMTWIWLVYAAAVVPLLMSVIYRWNGARWTGVVLFTLAFGLHTASLALRWHISGRIPNSNMFEAISAATWFGSLSAYIIEFLVRKTPLRSIFYLGGAVASMVAAMCAHFLPVTLNSDIDNIMPILHDVWLYIHTNMIIFSYALIGMAAVSALLYLRHRIGGGDPDAAVLGGAGSLIVKGSRSFIRKDTVSFAQVLDGATMVLMELSFVTLWTGLVMGAIWADHSWGRPWGWDPKEVFALNTFIVFLLLVHVRYKVRDKGLWTAILATIGCGVMLFNWIVINFVISGLHSYA